MRVNVDLFCDYIRLMNATVSGACKVAVMRMKIFTLIGCYTL
jgi:hypothetical protein